MGRQANESVARPADVVRFLSQSDNRVAILAALAEDGAMDRYELESTVDATRRTVLRTLNRLAERGSSRRATRATG